MNGACDLKAISSSTVIFRRGDRRNLVEREEAKSSSGRIEAWRRSRVVAALLGRGLRELVASY